MFDYAIAYILFLDDTYRVDYVDHKGRKTTEKYNDFDSMFRAWRDCPAKNHDYGTITDWTHEEIDALNSVAF